MVRQPFAESCAVSTTINQQIRQSIAALNKLGYYYVYIVLVTVNIVQKYSPFYLSAVALCVAVVVLFPFCKYYIDPDSVAYLTIAQRYADGEILKAVNGLWSPLSCWLTALLVKYGVGMMLAAVAVNAIGALGVLYITQSLLLHYKISRNTQWLLQMALVVFGAYAVYFQLFADLWECFLLLSVWRIMVVDHFVHRPMLWLAAGLVGAVAYMAKAYSLPFFVLNMLVCSYLMTKDEQTSKWQWVKISAIAIITLLIASSPWLYLLHEKYGKWMTSTSGGMNTSISLIGHAIWKDGIHYLIPPSYADSPYYWEDPYLLMGKMPHFWDSPRLMALQALRVGQRILQMAQCMNEISCCLLPLWILSLLIVFSKQVSSYFPKSFRWIALTMVLFPSGFFLAHFEARYMWYMLPLSMIMGVFIIQQLQTYIQKNWLRHLVTVAFIFSYICWPVWDIKHLIHEGKEQYTIAQQLKAQHIEGTFAANVTENKDVQQVARIAYYTHNPYYNAPIGDFSYLDLLYEIRKYHIKYYFYFYSKMDGQQYVMKDENGVPFKEVTQGSIAGLLVFQVN